MIAADPEVTTDMIVHKSETGRAEADDKSSSVQVDQKEVNKMLEFDCQAWNHYQENEKGANGFVVAKT